MARGMQARDGAGCPWKAKGRPDGARVAGIISPAEDRCGEQGKGVGDSFVGARSSSRVRGTAGNEEAARCMYRVIPAGAGNRTARSPRSASGSGHPRGCGEQSARAARMWRWPDHPRGCGEQVWRLLDDRTVIVTHHQPSPAIGGRATSVSPFFVSNLDGWIADHRPDLWLCGHAHHRLQAKIGATALRDISFGYPHEVLPQQEAGLLRRGKIDTNLPELLVH